MHLQCCKVVDWGSGRYMSWKCCPSNHEQRFSICRCKEDTRGDIFHSHLDPMCNTLPWLASRVRWEIALGYADHTESQVNNKIYSQPLMGFKCDERINWKERDSATWHYTICYNFYHMQSLFNAEVDNLIYNYTLYIIIFTCLLIT